MKKNYKEALAAFIILYSLMVPTYLTPKGGRAQVAAVSAKTPQPIVQKPRKIEKPSEEEQSEPEIISNAKQIKAFVPQPGIFTRMYLGFTPIILSSLNTAIGAGIAAATKVVLAGFLEARQYTLAKKAAQEYAKDEIQKGLFSGAQFAQFTPQQKIDLATETILKSNKINMAEMDASTSYSALFSQGLYPAKLNIGASLISGFITMGVALLLQSLMPQSE